MNTDIMTVTAGCMVSWSTGTPRPPERHKNKLAEWTRANGSGMVLSVRTQTSPEGIEVPSYFTVDLGSISGANTIVAKFRRTVLIGDTAGYAVVSRPAPGSALVFESNSRTADIVHVAANQADAEKWLNGKGYPSARVEVVPRLDTDREAGAPATPSNLVFERTDSGLDVFIIGDTGYTPVTRGGSISVFYTWRNSQPVKDWKINEFFHAGHILDDLEQFRSLMIELAQHDLDLEKLGRKRTGRAPTNTPWGMSQSCEDYAEGVAFYGTAGHGGIRLSPERNACVHTAWRDRSGWYEEDLCYAIVAHTFPDLFTAYERKACEKSLKNSMPYEWEAVTGKTIPEEESSRKREDAFYQRHADDWVLSSATGHDLDPSLIECTARKGRGLGPNPEEKTFLVPRAEYEKRRYQFVIDPDRHPLLPEKQAAA